MKKHSSTEDIALKHYYNSMHSNKSSRDLIKNSMHTTKDTKRVEFSVDTKQAQETKLSTQESRDYNEEFNVYKPASVRLYTALNSSCRRSKSILTDSFHQQLQRIVYTS